MAAKFLIRLGGAAGLSLLVGFTPAVAAGTSVSDTGKKDAPKAKVVGTPGSAASVRASAKPPVMPAKPERIDMKTRPSDSIMAPPPALEKHDSTAAVRTGKDTAKAASKKPVVHKTDEKKPAAKKPAH